MINSFPLTSVMSIRPDPKPTAPAEAESNPENDDITFLKSLAEKSTESNNETPVSDSVDEDSTKNRRLADDYDSTKSGMDYKYQGEKYRNPAVISETPAIPTTHFTLTFKFMCEESIKVKIYSAISQKTEGKKQYNYITI